MARRGLGKGIDALIPSVLGKGSEEIMEIDPKDIKTNPYQPRQIFDDKKIDELAASMEEHGVIQPLIVRREGIGFQLVAGERRLRAALQAGLKKVPTVVKSLSDQEAMEISLVENLQREDLGPLEQAEAYKRLVDEFGLTQEEVSQRVGKSRSDVANTLRLLRLEPEVKQMINEGRISGGHGRALVGLSRSKQLQIAKTIVDKGLSVRSAEKAASPKARTKRTEKTVPRRTRVKAAEELLSAALGSPVNVEKVGDKGTISVRFYGEEDLERLVEIMTGESR